ncbi:MAG: helix-turn-helix transcriptional regulator [Gaiellaceae bacterium]
MEVKMAPTLGGELHKVRKLRGLSLKAVADPAGMSATYLQKLERDEVESPSPHRLQSLAEVLGLDYGDLFVLAGYPAPTANGSAETSVPRRHGQMDVAGAKGSLLRKAFQSEEHVTDEELDQLARYLVFLREQSGESKS